jgi:perosamine synthetase
MADRTIPLYKVHMPTEVKEALNAVIFSGQLAHGPNVGVFESQLQAYIGNPYLTTTREISSSIQLCLSMAGVGPGDEVLASPMACVATNMPVLNLFAKIKWVDVDASTGNISVADLEEQITEKTKAVLLYHWAGNPVDLSIITAIAEKHGIPVIDDAGEAMGAEITGRKIGNTGCTYTVFSFHAIRHITTGDGAAISFGKKEDFDKGVLLKRYGIHQSTFRDDMGEINPASDIDSAGYNNYLNHLEATIGSIQMNYLPDIIARHRENGLYFDETLRAIPGLTVLKRPENSKSAYWVYTFLAENRDDLLRMLRNHGIYASRVHHRNDIYSCFGSFQRELPGTDEFHAKYINIPCGWWVSKEDREFIVDVLRKGW